MSMEQVVTQLPVRASNSLATAQVRKDTPSLIDVRGSGASEGVHWP